MSTNPIESPWTWLRGAAALVAVTFFAIAGGCGSGSDKPIPTASCSRCGSSEVTADECKMLGTKNGCEVSGTDMVECGGTQVMGCTFENCDEPPDCAE